MISWTSDELTKIGEADDPDRHRGAQRAVAPERCEFQLVRLGDDLYVRSVNGRAAAWFRGTQVRHEGHIRADGVDKDVTFVDGDHTLDDELDASYRAKYRRYAANIVDSVLSPEARAATIKLVPRSTTS